MKIMKIMKSNSKKLTFLLLLAVSMMIQPTVKSFAEEVLETNCCTILGMYPMPLNYAVKNPKMLCIFYHYKKVLNVKIMG